MSNGSRSLPSGHRRRSNQGGSECPGSRATKRDTGNSAKRRPITAGPWNMPRGRLLFGEPRTPTASSMAGAARNTGLQACRRCWPVEATSSPQWSRENSRLRRRAHPARIPARGVHRDPHVYRSRFPGELVPPSRAADVVVGGGTDQGVGVVLTGDHASAAFCAGKSPTPPLAGPATCRYGTALDKRDIRPYDKASCWARGAGQVRSRESGGHA